MTPGRIHRTAEALITLTEEALNHILTLCLLVYSQDSSSYLNKILSAAPSEQVDPVLQQPVPGLAGQRERAVLMVRDARVPQRAAVLLEVSLLSHAAGPVHSSAGTPDNSLLQSFSVTEMRVEK